MGNCSNKSEHREKEKEKVQIQTVSKSNYQLMHVIGKGGFGKVRYS